MKSKIVRAVTPPRKTALNRALNEQFKQLIPVLFLVAAPAAQAVDYTWQDGTGNWTDSNWSVAGFPNASTSNAHIDGGNPVNSVVNLNTSASVGTLGIDSGDILNLLNGTSLTLNGGTSTNNGMLSVNGVNSYTGLRLTGDTTLAGSGSTVLGSSSYSYISNTDNTVRTLTVGAGHTVKGAGYLGYSPSIGYQSLKLVNQGTVLADGAGSLKVYVSDANGTPGFDNSAG